MYREKTLKLNSCVRIEGDNTAATIHGTFSENNVSSGLQLKIV